MEQKNRKIAILIADPHDGRGGLENVLVEITQGLEKKNIDTYIGMLEAPLHREILEEFPHVETFTGRGDLTLGSKKPTFLLRLIWKYRCRKTLKSFFKRLDDIQPDAFIMINFPEKFQHHATLFSAYKKKNPKLPFIAWPHGSLITLSEKRTKKLQETIHIWDDFLAISAGIEDELKNIYGINHAFLVHNPIKESRIVKRELHRFIYIGRIDAPEKRVKKLITIFSQLTGIWRLDLYGSFDSSATKERMMAYVRSLNIQDNVYFHGWVNNPWDEIKSAGVLLLNSSTEGLALVLVEAMMRGIPCISSNCPVGPKEIIQNDVNGWLFPVNKMEECLKIMQEIIDHERPLPAQEQIQKSVKRFSSQTVIDNFSNIINRIIDKKIDQNNPDKLRGKYE